MTWRSGVRFERRGWGIKINYDREIAQDDQLIQWAQRSIQNGWYRRQIPSADGSRSYDLIEFWDLVISFRDVAASMGYSAQDIADLADRIDADVWKIHPDLPDPQCGPAGYQRGKEIVAEIDATCAGHFLFKDEADAKAHLKKAKASRARHVRNKDKYGAPANSTAAKP